MNKLNKIFAILAVIVMVLSVTMSVNASTNNDVIAYISKAHTVNGRTMQLNSTQVQQLTQYLTNHPVDDATADQIIANLDSAKKTITDAGATRLNDLKDSTKSQVMNYVKTAGSLAGLKVEFDTSKETVTIKDMNGNVIVSTTSYSDLNAYTPSKNDSSSNNSSSGTKSSGKLVYTGNNYSTAIIAVVAIVAIATAGIVIKNKNAR